MFFELFCSACSRTSCFIFVFSVGGYHAEVLRYLVELLVAQIREFEAPLYCDDSPWSWHLEYQVGIVRYFHESRKCGSPEDRLILRGLMSTNASILVDSVGPPSAEVCRTAASFP
jgi:hypothetical protein